MGIDVDSLRFLLLSRAGGVRFARTTTLGRLSLYLDAEVMSQTFKGFGHELSAGHSERMLVEAGGYADPLFRRLGADRVQSIDASDYQGATVSFDLNDSLPPELRARASVVFDGGTLEHVFDAPTALRNCMEMVEIGGHLLVSAPANNYFGHGFYQFSPEFYFRALSRENGFEIELVLAKIDVTPQRWYRVTDPAISGRRATLPSDAAPTTIMVQARRVSGRAALQMMPQQSDYRAAWKADAGVGGASRRIARRYLPPAARSAIGSVTRTRREGGVEAVSVEVTPEGLARPPSSPTAGTR